MGSQLKSEGERLTGRQTDSNRDRKRDGEADRQTDSNRDRKRDGEADRQQ